MGAALCKKDSAFCICCQSSSHVSKQETSVPNQQAASLWYENRTAQQSHCVLLYNYKPRTADDLLIKKGEEIEVLQQEGEWALVRKIDASREMEQQEKGYVPSSFVAEVGSVAAAPWFFGSMLHMDVKRCLLRDENQNGSFVVWQNKEMNDNYFLSVRYDDIVKHYKICGDSSFQALSQIIKQYSKEAGCLGTRLHEPCIKLDQPSLCTLAHVADWEIQHSSLQKVQLIGSGQCGEVWKGIWNGTTEVAIKVLKGVGSKSKKSFLEEAKIMKQLRHERLVKLLAVCTESEPYCIVTELMKWGNLQKYLRFHSERRNLDVSLLSGFAIQIAEGMTYLEEKCYIHRDLRTENILLTEMLSCKIADFGLARLLENGQCRLSLDIKVPIKWMAPEIFINNIYTTKSDVWSFGVLLTEIVTFGDMPFPDKENTEFVKDLMNGVMPPPAGCPESFHDMMLQCWEQESEKRPTFKQLQNTLMKCNPVPETEELR
ncbi:tyrosine-protein kinase Src42A [Scyliorhinus torazame]